MREEPSPAGGRGEGEGGSNSRKARRGGANHPHPNPLPGGEGDTGRLSSYAISLGLLLAALVAGLVVAGVEGGAATFWAFRDFVALRHVDLVVAFLTAEIAGLLGPLACMRRHGVLLWLGRVDGFNQHEPARETDDG